MDTSRQVADGITSKSELVATQRQRRSMAEKRRIVEETLVEGASVARVARAHGINANQVFGWRRLYLVGRLGECKPAMKLLPVHVSESLPAALPVRRAGGKNVLRCRSGRLKPVGRARASASFRERWRRLPEAQGAPRQL